MPRPHIYGSCGFEDCPACNRIYDSERDDLAHFSEPEREQMADMAADRYERQIDRYWGYGG
jgi:hypothetical protein